MPAHRPSNEYKSQWCSFSIHGPTVSNSLPYDLQSTDISLDTFTNKLKTFLFGAYVCISATFVNLGYISGLAPSYPTEYCTMTSDAGCRYVRSANTCQLIIPQMSTSYNDAASLSVDQLCHTACHTICSLQTSRWTRSRTNWKHFCLALTCALALLLRIWVI